MDEVWDIPQQASGEKWDIPATSASSSEEKWDVQPGTEKSLTAKSTDELVSDLAKMPVEQRLVKILSGIPVGSLEVGLQMAAQIPQMLAGGVGFAKAVKEGDLSEKGIQQATQDVTPQWVHDLATADAVQPQTYTGQLMSRGIGEAFHQVGRGLAAPGAAVKATAFVDEGDEAKPWLQRYQESYEQTAPTTEQLLNLAVAGKMTKGAFDYTRDVNRGLNITANEVKRRAAEGANKIASANEAKQLEKGALAGWENEGGMSYTEKGRPVTPTAKEEPAPLPALNPEFQVEKTLDEAQSDFDALIQQEAPLPAIEKPAKKGRNKNSYPKIEDPPVVRQPSIQESAKIDKGQGGYLDPSVFIEGIKKAFSMTDEMYEAFKEKAQAHYSEFQTIPDLVDFLRKTKIQDLPTELSGFITTQNQLAQMAAGNKVVPFVFNYLADRNRQSETRVYGYDQTVRPILQWAQKNLPETAKFFRYWESLNAKPEYRQLRAELENMGTEGRVQHFVSKGIDETTARTLMPLVDVMKDIQSADSKSLESHGRTLQNEPFYFPLSRPGPYHFVLTDENGNVRYAAGHESLADARHALEEYKKKLPDGWRASDVIRTDPSKVINSAMGQAILQAAPPWLRDVAMAQYMKRIEFQRNFELQRAEDYEVGGYLGEIDPLGAQGTKDLANKYLAAISHRIRESHHLENASAAVELARDLLTPSDLLKDSAPNTYKWLHSIVARHIGMDISSIPAIDRGLQNIADAVGKRITKLDGIMKDYVPGENDNVVGPNLVKEYVKHFTYLTSMMKLGLNSQVILGNAFQNLQIGPDMARAAFRLGVSPAHAIAAQIEGLAYMSTFGKLDRHSYIGEKMDQAKREGMIDPHGREDYSVAENVDRFNDVGPVDKAIQYPRDIVERATNWNAILHYRFFVESAFPDLTDIQKDRMVYNLSRSFTGDYSKVANLMAFEKAGTVGNLGSNFAKWKFNRTSRYLDDILMASRVSKYGVTAVMPLVMSMTMGLMTAGVLGGIGMVDYEAIRRLGQALGPKWGWDLKPMAALLTEDTPIGKLKGNMRTFVMRGGVTAFGDAVAQQFGEKSGPDVSTSIRESSIIEAPTVAVQTAGDIATLIGVFAKSGISSGWFNKMLDDMPEGYMKDLAKYATKGSRWGVTSDDMKNAYSAFPVFIQEALKEYGIPGIAKPTNIKSGDMTVVPEPGKEEGKFIRTPYQEALALGGLKTTEENDFSEGRGYQKQQTNANKAELTALKDGVKQNLDNPALILRNYQQIVSQHGESAWDDLMNDLDARELEKLRTDFFGLQALSINNMRGDQIAQQRAIERLKKSLAVARRGE